MFTQNTLIKCLQKPNKNLLKFKFRTKSKRCEMLISPNAYLNVQQRIPKIHIWLRKLDTWSSTFREQTKAHQKHRIQMRKRREINSWIKFMWSLIAFLFIFIPKGNIDCGECNYFPIIFTQVVLYSSWNRDHHYHLLIIFTLHGMKK